MWLLSCESDLLDGKSIWLRPGSQHLLGRTTTTTSTAEHVRYINHRSISRKHLLITIDPVKPGDSKLIHARSKITLTDSSKSGSHLNNAPFSQSKRSIERDDNKIQLGTSDYIFHIRWKPVVLTFTNLTSEQKSKKDPIEEFRELFEHADVKLFSTYLTDSTTHVIAIGRNNPPCLQALAQARWVVGYDWLTALKLAVQADVSGVDQSALEIDFEGKWPAEKEFLLPTGQEPVPRPAEMLIPNAQRAEAFHGLTFVFMSKRQLDTLMPVILTAGGKAIHVNVVAKETTARSFVEDVQNTVRESKTRSITTAEILVKTVIIAPSKPKEDVEWWSTFEDEVQTETRRKLTLQSAFLDAILCLDTTGLIQALPNVESSDPITTTHPESMQKSSKSRRLGAVSRFKGFESFDPSQITHVEDTAPEVSVDVMDIEEGGISKKRPAEDDGMEAHLPGFVEMKKRKVDIKPLVQEPPEEEQRPKDLLGKQRKEQVINVKAKLQEQRKREEEERLIREECLNHQLDGLTVEDMKKFVQHEEFDVVVQDAPVTRKAQQHSGDRWSSAWNDRPNFKAFRRQGQSREARTHRVMISLEPTTIRPDGLLGEYYLEPRHGAERNNQSSIRQSQPSSNGQMFSYADESQTLAMMTQTQTGQKRLLSDQLAGRSVKKPRTTRAVVNLEDDDDDELQFRRRVR